MFLRCIHRTPAISTDGNRLLATCLLVASDDGVLQVRPLETTLTGVELAAILRSLNAAEVAQGLKEVVFDLRNVELIGPQWTVVLAMMIDFARRLAARCRLVSLKQQPAAAASVYRHSPELMRLIDRERRRQRPRREREWVVDPSDQSDPSYPR